MSAFDLWHAISVNSFNSSRMETVQRQSLASFHPPALRGPLPSPKLIPCSTAVYAVKAPFSVVSPPNPSCCTKQNYENTLALTQSSITQCHAPDEINQFYFLLPPVYILYVR